MREIDCNDIPPYIREAMQASDDRARTIIELADANARRKDLLQKRIEAHVRLENLLNTHPKGPKAGLIAILANDTWAKAQNSNVYYKQIALQGYAEKFIPTMKQELSTKHLGLFVTKKEKQLRRDFVKSVIDGDTSNPLAVKMAKEANKMFDFLRERFNRFGGDIGKLRTGKGYMPQSHNPDAIRKSTPEEWKAFTYDLLDDATKMDIDRGALDLDFVYETIITGGVNKIKDSAVGGGAGRGKSTANKHAEERVLDFKDGDAWLTYQEKFGTPDPMAAIDNHIRSMTTDMALIEVLGPNPDAMFKTLIDSVEARNTLAGRKNPGAGLDMLQKVYNVVSGKVDIDMARFQYAGVFQMLRAANTATLLNNATISTITDPLLASFTAGYKGMNPLETLGGYVKNFAKSGSKRGFEEQQLMGLGADVFSSEVTRRYSELGAGFWAKASEAVMRGTLMNVLTESARMSFKAQYFKKLLNGRKIEDLTTDEHIRILELVNEEADYAVIMGDPRARALTTLGESKGTVTGELARSTTQFLTFPVSFMVKQGSRLLRQQSSLGSAFAYFGVLFPLLTLGGAIAMIGKDASKGYGVRQGWNPFDEDNDPKDVMKFWGAAATQGGGIGIAGDFLFSDVNRFGGGKAVTFGGPTTGTAGDLLDLTYGNVQEAFDPDNKNTHFGSELVEFTNRHLNPVKTWYTQMLWEHYAIRNLKIMLDEDYEREERRKRRKREKEYKQEQFEFLED